LRAQRLARGWSRSELARRAGLSARAVLLYEDKGFRPRTATLARLAQALGLPPEALEPGGPVPGK
jgi:transcriptional regulator with XRE-family HTH domain